MVLLLACETRWPFIGFLPVTWQMRDIGSSRMTRKARILHQSALGEGDRLVAGDDEVIQDLDVDERQRLLEAAGQQLVRPARLCRAGRVVVGEDHRRRVYLEGRLDDLARVNAGLRQRAAEWLVEADDPVLRVEPDADEHLLLPRADGKAKIVAHGRRRSEQRSRLELFADRAARKLERGRELGALCRTEPLYAGELGGKHPADAAEGLEELAGELDRVLAADARAQQHGDELGVGQVSRAALEQSLARPLRNGPAGNRHGQG